MSFLDHLRVQFFGKFQKHEPLTSLLQKVISNKYICVFYEEINDRVQFYAIILTEPYTFATELAKWKNVLQNALQLSVYQNFRSFFTYI